MSVQQVGGSGTSSSSLSASLPLNNEAVFRIELSFSSRKSSVIVMRCTARLYSLEKVGQGGATGQAAGQATGSQADGAGDGEWKSIAYGVPCIQLMRESVEHNSNFHIKLIMAEVESGIGLWECKLEKGSKYNAMQNNFHTFSVNGKPHAVQFANETEAVRMLESVQDLLYQKEQAETVSFDAKRAEEGIFKKPKLFKKLNKKDISAPCNFKHVSGITAGRTRVCEDELRGTIQRKLRTMSLSNLTSRRPKPRPQSEVVRLEDSGTASDTPPTPRRHREGGAKIAKSSSFKHKFSRKKQQEHTPLRITEVKDAESTDLGKAFARNADNRRSLPSRFRKHARPAITSDTFTNGVGNGELSPSRALSRSSGDLASPTQQSFDPFQKPGEQDTGATITRSNTIQGGTFNYTPYSKTLESQKRKSATLDNHSQSSLHEKRPSLSSTGRQYNSEISLNYSQQKVAGATAGGGVAYQGGPPRTRHSRTSFHEGQIPSTVPEVPAHRNNYPSEDWSSSTLPGSNRRSVQEIPLGQANGRGPEGYHSQRVMRASGSLQKINANYPIGRVSNHSRPNLTMSAQNLSSIPDGSAVGVVPPPSFVTEKPPPSSSPAHMTAPHGSLSVLKIPEQPRRNSLPYAVVGVGENPELSTFAPAKPHAGSTQDVPRTSGEHYDLLNPRSTKSAKAPTFKPEQYDLLNPKPSSNSTVLMGTTSVQYDLLNPKRVRPVQVTAPQVPMVAFNHIEESDGVPRRHQQLQQERNQQQLQQQQLLLQQQQQRQLQLLQQQHQQEQLHLQQQQQQQLRQLQQQSMYSRGAVMSTASQHTRADTNVSPSHSQSKVSPIPVQSYPENGPVQQGFTTHDGSNTQPEAPDANPMTDSQVPDPTSSRGAVYPNGNIPGQLHPHCKTATDPAQNRLRPNSGRHRSANVSFDGNESLASTSSVDVDMATYTEQMSRALEQFDDLLSTRKPSIIQTSF